MKFLKGQTLLALMISLALSSLLLLGISSFYAHTQTQNQQLLLRLKLQAELQRTLQLMGKDLRRVGFRALNARLTETNLSLFELDDQGTAIFIAQEDNAPKNSCVLFFYDLDKNGCIGTGSPKTCMRNGKNAAKGSTEELFGYKISNKMIKTKLTYQSVISATCTAETCKRAFQQAACNAGGGWTDLLDTCEYEITRLQFHWLEEGRGLEIQLAGNLKQYPHITYETALVVALWNQK